VCPAAAARRAYTRPAVHTACPGHTPASSTITADLHELILVSIHDGCIRELGSLVAPTRPMPLQEMATTA
jgi:hypothetical protein